MTSSSGIGRPIDVSYRSNRWALIGAALAGLVNGLVHLLRDAEIAVLESFLVGMAVFLTWAIARELDPDNAGSAVLAMGIVAPIIILTTASPGVAAVALLGTRVIAGTVGRGLTPVDKLVLIGVAAYAGSRAEAWPLVLLIAAGLLVEGGMASRRTAFASIAAAAATAVLLDVQPQPDPEIASLLQVALVALTMMFLVPVPVVRSRCDNEETPIAPRRVALARLGLAGAVVVGSLFAGGSFASMVPMTGALLATVLVSFLESRRSLKTSASKQ